MYDVLEDISELSFLSHLKTISSEKSTLHWQCPTVAGTNLETSGFILGECVFPTDTSTTLIAIRWSTPSVLSVPSVITVSSAWRPTRSKMASGFVRENRGRMYSAQHFDDNAPIELRQWTNL